MLTGFSYVGLEWKAHISSFRNPPRDPKLVTTINLLHLKIFFLEILTFTYSFVTKKVICNLNSLQYGTSYRSTSPENFDPVWSTWNQFQEFRKVAFPNNSLKFLGLMSQNQMNGVHIYLIFYVFLPFAKMMKRWLFWSFWSIEIATGKPVLWDH